ncbi:ATP-binding protein [Aliiroseovarius crassostreae]|uniref:ATP-binding protein n=1 Tax=Aliiroseovarius crassostreae TaxID=154981 RepID=UPI0021FB5106|nr:ATP-binding protein [Aliiroseovarius crassostreae]UWP88441.1 ATP-binding protein [Aliiroseovarius crassostreae]
MNTLASIIDPSKRIGTVTRATANMTELTLPKAFAPLGRRGISKGSVGDFVFIDCDRTAILGRITEVVIPERQRSALETQIESDPSIDPQGRVQLLATVSKTTGEVTRGIATQPNVGDGVFHAEGEALTASIKGALASGIKSDGAPLFIELGNLSGLNEASLSIPPEKLFGRHCGVFGATGGGKSWTVSRLVNEAVRIGGKCILFDPTGEFTHKVGGAKQFAFSEAGDDQPLARFPSEKLSELDLHALLTPTGQSQGPALRRATKSLRISRILQANEVKFPTKVDGGRKTVLIHHGDNPVGNVVIEDQGTIEKANQSRVAFSRAELDLADELAAESCQFDFASLSRQVRNECVRPVHNSNPSLFGQLDISAVGYCNSLIIRIETFLTSPELACMFSNDGLDICAEIERFLATPDERALVLSFERVSFKHNTRELLLNALGRYLLNLAREGRFRKNPLVCFLDEAHQFIGKSVGDEFNSVKLDAFGLIAKEGRKYGLTTVIATQRPRDVPQDVLSQLGTLFVHRLTNDRDRDTIERACGDLDRSAAAFIPSLAAGEAIMVGPDLPAPLPIMMGRPEKGQQPESHGPMYQEYWGNSVEVFDSEAPIEPGDAAQNAI